MVKVTPLEAREIQEAIREAAKQEKSLATLPALSRILEPFRGQGLIANTDQIRDAISKIVQYVIKVRKTPKLRSAQRKSGFDVEEVLVTIVQILENSGMSSLLAQIATELENRGQFDAADVLRNALGRSGSSKRGPPMTTY